MHKTLIEILEGVPDYRKGNAIRHILSEILLIGILSILSQGDGYEAMHLFGIAHEEVLRQYLCLPHGIPSADTFERIFTYINPRALQAQFQPWVDEIISDIKERLNVSIDGKTARRSRDANIKATHIVTAFASDLQIVLGQLATDEKSNEITAIPKLLEMFCQKGMLITIDAMGTQTDIAETINRLGGDYILSVKGNQPTLLEDVSLYLKTEVMTQDKDTLRENGQYQRTIEKGHGRAETREAYVFNDVSWLENAPNWAGLSGFGVIVSKRELIGKDSKPEISYRYFIYSDGSTTASDLLRDVRSHWAIENNLHWSLDMTFREDDSRARLGNAQENLNILRKQVMQMLKKDTTVKKSLKSKLLLCAWDIDYALRIMGVK